MFSTIWKRFSRGDLLSIGREFEKKIIHDLKQRGWWTYLTPNTISGQPFDIIAISDGTGIAIEVKHVKEYRFNLSRIEANQRIAIQDFTEKGNDAFFVFGHDDIIYIADAEQILDCKDKSIDIRTLAKWSSWI